MSLTTRDQDGQQQAELKKTLQKIHQIVRENHRLTFRGRAGQVNIDRDTVRKILTEEIDMRTVCAKMFQNELTEEQKQRTVTICQDLSERQDDILGRVITGDETWVYQYDPETKLLIAQWKISNSPRPKISVGANQDSKQYC